MFPVLVAIGVVAAAWCLAPKLHRFAYWATRKDRAAVAAAAVGGWQLASLAPDAGVELVGLQRPPARPDGTWLLFLPGNASDVVAAFAPVLAPLCRERGVGAAFWPWRGFDASTGTPSPAGLLADARAGWRHLTDGLGVPPARIELWGYSLGSGIAVQLAADLCSAGTPPRRVVLLAAYDRITVMGAGALSRLRPGDVYDAIASAAAVRCPVTIVHGGADDALPVAGAAALQRAIGPSARLLVLPSRGHTDWLAGLAQLDLW